MSSSITITNGGSGYNGSPLVTFSSSAKPSLITISAAGGNVLEITAKGDIKYTGRPSKAADAFVKTLSGSIDINTIGPAAMARSYRKAIERCLRDAQRMGREEFIAMLENELQTRYSKAVLASLKEDE